MARTEKITVGCVIALIAGLIAFIAMANEEICPPNQTYQVIKYEPQFNGADMPTYKPIYGCK